MLELIRRSDEFPPYSYRVLLYCLGIVVLLNVCGHKAKAQQIIRPENQETSLVGTIRLVHGFGPPGFGEDPKHDARVSYWALNLPIPVNTPCAQSEFGCESAKSLKLFFPGSELTRLADEPAAKWKNQRVIVKGKLHHADTAGEMTAIYMDVSSIQAAQIGAR